jgi:hypothetical protein
MGSARESASPFIKTFISLADELFPSVHPPKENISKALHQVSQKPNCSYTDAVSLIAAKPHLPPDHLI